LKSYKPVVSFLIFTFLLALPAVLLKYVDGGDWLVPGFWGMFLFLSAITLMVVIFVLAVQQRNSEMYASAFLGATTFKLLACLVFVLVFVRKSHPEKYVFVADFMYLYLLNTGFEIYGLLHNLRNQKLR
jgi:F0F1-type ATP synthase assembly protein I